MVRCDQTANRDITPPLKGELPRNLHEVEQEQNKKENRAVTEQGQAVRTGMVGINRT